MGLLDALGQDLIEESSLYSRDVFTGEPSNHQNPRRELINAQKQEDERAMYDEK
jgi:hypothetical protein